MTAQGAPWEHSIAARVNGIIKGEYWNCYAVGNVSAALEVVQEGIRRYNEEREQPSCKRKSAYQNRMKKQQDDEKMAIPKGLSSHFRIIEQWYIANRTKRKIVKLF